MRTRLHLSRNEFAAPLSFAVFLFVLLGGAAAPKAKISFSTTGLRSIKFAGSELLKDGRPRLRYVVFEKQELNADGHRQYQFDKADVAKPRVSYSSRKKRLRYTYPWGTAEFVYTVKSGRLDVAVTLSNPHRSGRTLADFGLELMQWQFPAAPGGKLKGGGAIKCSLDNLAIIEAPYGQKKLVACAKTIYPPVYFGLDKATDREQRIYPVLVRGGVQTSEPGACQFHPHGLPRIPPGKRLTLEFTFRFAAANVPADRLLADVYRKFREFHQPRLVWKDRRPIGAIFLPTGKGPANNPRNWFKKQELDVKTPAGKAELRKLFMEFADRCVKELKRMNAQGMIVWDLEGGENPHPITYIGDPRMVKILAPEADAIYDEFFKKFRDAGLRTGCTLRPTQVYYNKEKKQWSHGTGSHGPERNPLKDNYDKIWPKGEPWWRFYPVAERLCRKIAYAKKRWGCTIFYVDTNGIHRQVGEAQQFKWALLESHVWRSIIRRHPDVLLIPEFAPAPAQYAYVSCYLQPPYSSARTRPHVKKLLPAAFSVSYVVNLSNNDFLKRRAELVEGVRQGDSLFFRGWFHDGYNDKIKRIYTDAARKKRAK